MDILSQNLINQVLLSEDNGEGKEYVEGDDIGRC